MSLALTPMVSSLMVCISTKPLLGWQLDEQNIAQVDLAAQVRTLQHENHKLRRVNAALIERVESGTAQHSESYTAFRHSVVLAEQVRERTDALNQTMADLKHSNTLLSDARHTAEIAHQHLIDAIKRILVKGLYFSIKHSVSYCLTRDLNASGIKVCIALMLAPVCLR